MKPPPHPHKRLTALLATLFCAALLSAVTMLPAPAAATATSTVTNPKAEVTGNATHFDGLGQPYGGCGLPQAQLDSQDFVALNVFNTPGDYSSHPRPVPPAQSGIIGAWNNGHNCGRYVQVTIGDYCTGTNDGAPGQPFCRGGAWTSDGYNGATLTMVVADSCADTNAWCRDDPNHLDLDTASLTRFQKDGTAVSGLPDHWNNRQVSWSYVSAPGYTGDIEIGFLQGAQRYWAAVSLSHLPNGIHGVQYLSGGTWHDAQMNGDMGESFILEPIAEGGTDFSIRVKDVSDAYVFDGRTYDFSLPASCSGTCSAPYTGVSYTTEGGGATTTPTTPPTTTPPTTPPAGAGCTATAQITNSWSGGFQADVTVANSGSESTKGWAVGLSLPSGASVGSVWNAAVDGSAPATTFRNVAYNGAIAPAGSTTFGMTVNGSGSSLGAPACTAS